MILAPLSDQLLRFAVFRAALPEEDVFCTEADIAEALEWGFPRVGIIAPDDQHPMKAAVRASGLPILTLGTRGTDLHDPLGLRSGVTIREIDYDVYELRRRITHSAQVPDWVNGVLLDMSRMCGYPLPAEFRAFARRLLEFPSRYNKLDSLGSVADLTSGALKARFRRRGLPSPFGYLSWLRVIAATRLLSDTSVSTVEAAVRLGYTSNGNFCRSIQAVSGLTTTELRSTHGRHRVLAAFVTRYLTPEARSAWDRLEGLFIRVA